MSTSKNSTTDNSVVSERPKQLLPFIIDDVKVHDTIFLSEDGGTPYLVLDIGKPFILIEDKITHFAYLYRPTSNLYMYV